MTEDRVAPTEVNLLNQAQDEVFARLYGEPLQNCPSELYVPPEALRVFLESFEGPLDFLLYLIRKQKFDVMDIPMARLTDQYIRYVEMVRESNLELAAAYLVMAATLMQIKSRLMLPKAPTPEGQEPEDPRAELMRRLFEYEKIRLLAQRLGNLPREGRDFWLSQVELPKEQLHYPDVTPNELGEVMLGLKSRLALFVHHRVSREELSIREHMTQILSRLQTEESLLFSSLLANPQDKYETAVWFLAMLELAKEGLIQIHQTQAFSPIYLSRPELTLT